MKTQEEEKPIYKLQSQAWRQENDSLSKVLTMQARGPKLGFPKAQINKNKRKQNKNRYGDMHLYFQLMRFR